MEEKVRKIKSFFKEVSFEEEGHKYFVNGKTLPISVSGLIKKFTREVDFDLIASNIDERDGLPKGTTKILWKLNSEAATSKGSRVHFFGEIYAFHRNLEPLFAQEVAVKKFWDDLPSHLVPVFTELQMYCLKTFFGGTADIILYNTKTGKFIIADYKTNKDIFKNFKGETLLYPFQDMLDMDYSKYELQFSFYQILFEQCGFEVEKRCLIWLKEEDYKLYFTKDLTKELRKFLYN